MPNNNAINFVGIATDSGTAAQSTASTTGYTIAGAGGVTTSASGSTITVDGSGAGSADFVLITATTVANAATVDFTGLSSTYLMYLVIIEDLIPVTNGVDINIRTSTDNGANYDSAAGNYTIAFFGTNSNETTTGTSISAFNGAQLIDNGTNEAFSAMVWFHNPSQATSYHRVDGWITNTRGTSGNTVGKTAFSGQRTSTTAVNAIRFFLSSGNISSARVNLYGIIAA